jgi:hypothetical protein
MKVIYLFEHNNNKYIGSTKDLKMRCHAHNQHKKQPRHNKCKLYQYLLENNINDIRPYVSVIEEIINEAEFTELMLRNLEQDYIDDIKPNLNCINAIKR